MFVVCALAAGIFTLPASIALRSALLGYPGDNYQHAWFVWHFAKAITAGRNPFYTHLLFYPHRIDLAWSTLDPLAGLFALPFGLIAGPVVAYNLSILLQLALAAFFARLLCLRICRNEAAALFGGIAFGFGPFLLSHALGHLSLVTAFPIPLYVLALDNILRKEKPSWKDGIFAGFALLLTALAHYNYTVFCVLLTAVVLLVDLAMDGVALIKRVWISFGVASLTFLATFSPVLFILLGKRADIPGPRTTDHILKYSADVLGFLIPSWNNLLFGSFARGLDPRIFVAGLEGTVYAGPIVLLLAALAFWKGRRMQRRWVLRATVAATVFYLLSLGPEFRILGWPSGIPAPAALLYHFRWARFVSAPARFDVIVMLCLAILSAIGLAWCLNHLERKWRKIALVIVASALLIAESLTVPFPKSSIVDPAATPGAAGPVQGCTMPASAQHGAVLTFPLQQWPYIQKAMWMQITDSGRFALVDGYLSYVPPDVWQEFYDLPLLRSLMSLQGTYHTRIDPAADRKSLPATIQKLDLSAVVVFDSPQRAAAIRYLEAALGRKGANAGSCTLFELRESPSRISSQSRIADMPAQGESEILGETSLEEEILPGAIRVAAPRGKSLRQQVTSSLR